jgi:tRNA(Ile)-lysidine synthase TilS/MesJ
MDLLPALGAFLDTHPLGRDDRLVIAFSGGGDSLALLWGLARLAPDRGGGLPLVAAHLDHGMDPGSAARATRAAALCACPWSPRASR